MPEKTSSPDKKQNHSRLWYWYGDALRAILRPAIAPLLAELIHAINDLQNRKVEKDGIEVDQYGFLKAKSK